MSVEANATTSKTQHIHNMTKLVQQITEALLNVRSCQFVAFTYLSKGAGELAKHVVHIGFNYHTAVEKSVTELEILIAENDATWTPLQKEAGSSIMASLKKTLEAHARGEQNADYTKKDQYIPIGNGVNINSTDNTIQVFGLAHHKTVLVPGFYKTVNSRPLTLAKREIEKQLTVGKFREFALDPSQIAGARINGDTLELASAGVE